MIATRRVRAFLIACVASASLQFAPASARPARSAARVPPTVRAPIPPTVRTAQGAKQVNGLEPPHTLAVTVTDEKGEYIVGLRPETFTVLDGGQQSEIVSFVVGDMPATVGILLDASGSMLGGESNPDRV